ncbi:NUDIX hydrolase [Thalassotalea castellviae]|uniref:NUDIX hydrolase n=1 Tax=Thalassotalea castellviae TaxID=3075612 RepID=A0ABU2ZXS2_9GAMM|nr:NUDIX hydrolase [Thalassotalea sp. W431]MDT0602345.1 NUDIX hydrolase [Thalassotalea sp. W431]
MAVYLGNTEKGEIEIIKEQVVYENDFAVIYDDYVKFPEGDGRYLRTEWKAPYGVMIFPKNSQGDILLIRNFRHENRSWTWEVPKGFGEIGLSSLECAKKELEEETGFEGINWNKLKTLKNSDFETHIYNVTILHKKEQSTPEVGESISEVRFFSKKEFQSLIFNDEVSDPITLFFLSYSMMEE